MEVFFVINFETGMCVKNTVIADNSARERLHFLSKYDFHHKGMVDCGVLRLQSYTIILI